MARVVFIDHMSDEPLLSMDRSDVVGVPREGEVVTMPGESGWRRVMRVEWKHLPVLTRATQHVHVLLGQEQGT